MFRSLRWRLTGWYVLLLAGVLLLFSAGIYLAVRELLLDNIDDVLRHQAALVAQTIDLAGSAPVPRREVALPVRRDSEHFTRLYRIQHKEAHPLPPYELNPKSPAKLVEMLEHPNGWVRTTANRLLSEGAGRSVTAELNAKAAGGRTAYGRMQANWVLHNLNLLDEEHLLAAVRDPDAVVRKNALRIVAEQGGSASAPPAQLVRALLADPDQRVRVAALVAGTTLTPTRELAEALVEAWPSFKDPHLEAAALAITAGDPLLFLTAALEANAATPLTSLVAQLARQIASQNKAESASALIFTLAGRPTADANLSAYLKPAVKPEADAALGDALKQLLVSDQTASAALPLIARWDLVAQVGDGAKSAVRKAESRLADRSLSDGERGRVAADLLGVRSLDAGILPTVTALLASDASLVLQRLVIESLGKTGDPAAGQAILAALPKLEPELREAAFGQLLNRAEWSSAVVQAMAARKLDPALLGTANLFRLRTHGDATVAKRAAEVIDELRGPEQKQKDELIARFRPEVVKPGDAANGAKLFTQNCAPCHKFKNEGADFAPNLNGMGAHGPEELTVHILDPNRVVEPNFFAINIETKDDLSYDGIVLRENSSVVVLRNQTAETEIPKDNIKSRRNTGRSLMPEGFEQLGPDGLRDLLTYLCADDKRFRILDLSAAYTADTSHGIYMTLESRDESLRFKKWGTIKHHDVPFAILSPQRTPTGRNVIVLKGGAGIAKNYPQEVEVKVGLPVTRLHFLSGVAGWGFPLGGEGKPVVKMTVHYAGGSTEEFVLKNGVEFADYIAKIDVPGSEPLENLDDLLNDGRQLRYFAKGLTRRGVVEKLTLAS